MLTSRRLLTVALLPAFALGCGGGDPSPSPTPTATAASGPSAAEKQAVVDQYALIVFTSYEDVLAGVEDLDTKLNALVATPSQATLDGARASWLAVRAIYGQTEVYRFYDGPIDDADGPEGLINAWPLDEAYIDYTQDGLEGEKVATGIVNDADGYPDITAQVLADANEAEGEETISTGFHAIEFLLWGQDFYADGPGRRPWEDFQAGNEAGFANADRRGEYLLTASGLLVENVQGLVTAWDPAVSDNYRAQFVGDDPDASLQKILRGMGALSAGELAGERMYTAYETKDQEDEHSCFSDNTLADIYGNALGIDNVYHGRYGSLDGVGIEDLIATLDATLDGEASTALAGSLTAIQAIPGPFDQAIQGADDAPGRQAVLAAVESLNDQGDLIVEVAAALGLGISLGV